MMNHMELSLEAGLRRGEYRKFRELHFVDLREALGLKKDPPV